MTTGSQILRTIVALAITFLVQTTATAAITTLSGSWEMRMGDSPFAEGIPAWTQDAQSENWVPFTLPGQPKPEARGESQFMWMRTRLPNITTDDTVIFVEAVDLIMETYIGGRRIFAHGDFSLPPARRFNGYGAILIPLTPADSGKTIFFRFNSSHINIGFVLAPSIGPYGEFIQWILLRDLDRLALSFLMVVMGILGGMIFVFNRKNLSYGAFALLAISAGIYLFTRSTIKFLIIEDMMTAYYLETISVYLLPVGYGAFIYNTFSRDRVHLGIQIVFSLFIIGSLTLPLFGVMLLKSLIFYQILAVPAMVMSLTVCVHNVVKGNREAVFFTAGIGATFLTNIIDILIATNIIQGIRSTNHWGFFVFSIFLATILVRRYLATQRDVVRFSQELQQRNDELKVVDKLKDQFLANTSHELRTPLVGILGIAESVLDGAVGPISENLHRNITLIVQSGRRLTSLINDILDFSKMRERTIETKREAVSLHDVCEIVLTTSYHLIGKNDVSLQNALPAELAKVRGDSNRIQQVLYNLVGNAIKFTKHGTVKLSAEETQDEIIVHISDTGTGISREHWESIFLPFEQGDASAERQSGGTGIGLTVTKQLVEVMGGRIWLDSTLGQGTTFSFTLPKATHDDPDATITEQALSSHIQEVGNATESELAQLICLSGYHGASILIVDDEPVNRQVLQNQLNRSGFTITEAQSGAEALQLLHGAPLPDIILLDVMMPGMSGYTVCSELRKTHSMDDLPIIFLTAKNQVANLVEGFSVGGNDYLTKPFSKNELLARIDVQLRLKSTNQHLKEALASLDEVLQLTRRMAISSEKEASLRIAIDAIVNKLPLPRPNHVDIENAETSTLGLKQELRRRFSWPDWVCTQTTTIAAQQPLQSDGADAENRDTFITEEERIILRAIHDGQSRANIEVPWKRTVDETTRRFIQFVIESLSVILTTFDLVDERDCEHRQRVEGEKHELVRLVGLAARVSDRLNSPLLVLFNTMDSLRQHLNALPTTQNSDDLMLFWGKSEHGLKESLDRLKSLSDELAEVRDQGEEMEATQSMTVDNNRLKLAGGE